MTGLRCTKCEITVAASWTWLWYPHEFKERSASSGKEVKRKRWLCPDCSSEFASDRWRNAFLRRAGEL
jgi:hypothetical protein